jgi:hypothetical protein
MAQQNLPFEIQTIQKGTEEYVNFIAEESRYFMHQAPFERGDNDVAVIELPLYRDSISLTIKLHGQGRVTLSHEIGHFNHIDIEEGEGDGDIVFSEGAMHSLEGTTLIIPLNTELVYSELPDNPDLYRLELVPMGEGSDSGSDMDVE